MHTFDLPKDLEKEYPLLHITQEYHNFNDLVINEDVVETLNNIISENKSIKKLNSYGLWPKNKILFSFIQEDHLEQGKHYLLKY